MKESPNGREPEQQPSEPKPAADEAQPGGFGRFAEVYRARWAANHPNMRPRGLPKAPPPDAAPPPPADDAEAEARADNGTTLGSAEERKRL